MKYDDLITSCVEEHYEVKNHVQRIGTLKQKVKNPPIRKKPWFDQKYSKWAKTIDVDGRAIAIFFDILINNPDEHSVDFVSDLMVKYKLMHPELFNAIANEDHKIEEEYEKATRTYEKNIQEYDELKVKSIPEKVTDINELWIKICDQLKEELTQETNLFKMQDETKKLVIVLAFLSRYFKIQDDMIVTDDFDQIYRFHLEHRIHVLRMWSVFVVGSKPKVPVGQLNDPRLINLLMKYGVDICW